MKKDPGWRRCFVLARRCSCDGACSSRAQRRLPVPARVARRPRAGARPQAAPAARRPTPRSIARGSISTASAATTAASRSRPTIRSTSKRPASTTCCRRRRDLGARAAQAERARDAAAGHAAPERSRVRGVHELAGRRRSIAPGRARATPGRYVVHRLNRTEYGNAVRDLLALDVDVAAAAAERRRRLRLRQHRDGAEDVAAAARALCHRGAAHQHAGGRRPEARARHHRVLDQPRVHQNGYIEGLPLGTRGGTVVRHMFPADGEYKLSGRLVRGVEEGYAGVEGNDTPHTFVITVDGDEVYSAQIGGPEGSRGAGARHERGAADHRRAHDRHASRSRPGRTTSASRGASGRPSGRTSGSRRCATARKST